MGDNKGHSQAANQCMGLQDDKKLQVEDVIVIVDYMISLVL